MKLYNNLMTQRAKREPKQSNDEKSYASTASRISPINKILLRQLRTALETRAIELYMRADTAKGRTKDDLIRRGNIMTDLYIVLGHLTSRTRTRKKG